MTEAGVLDVVSALDVREALKAAVPHDRVDIDCGGLTFCDCTGLPARALARLAARTGAATVITSVPVHPPGPHLTPTTASRTADPPVPFTTPRR
ncbi:hypothetical protein ACFQ7M_19820 [Streptomyces massasporeus]